MSNRTSRSQHTDHTNKYRLPTHAKVGIVIEPILDSTNSRLTDSKLKIFSTGKDTYDVGSCIIRALDIQTVSNTNLSVYPPYDQLNLDIPLVGETVELIKIGSIVYYKRINKGDINIGNAIENFEKDTFEEVEPSTTRANDYNTSSQTGITNTSGKSDRDAKIGKYFSETQTNRLKLYEGDKLIQSRFGQSIRFSGYNNSDNKYSPTILIRNKQNSFSLNKLKSGDVTEEDINRDGSTIALVSNNYKLAFQPGTIDDGGNTNFKTKPKHFTNYPSELTGQDQILINSERIIFSSKAAEMIFYSKGNWGFISDGTMSIDNGNAGALLDFNGDVKLTTNDFNTFILGGKGKIYLNTEKDAEPLARGETLRKILSDLIDLIVKQVYPTPSGPTSVGPTNTADFKKLQSKLDTVLSTLNYTE